MAEYAFQRLGRLMRGELTLCSALGQGTTMRITLRFDVPDGV